MATVSIAIEPVKRSPLDPLYEGLPVVIVDQWDDITDDNLRRWHEQHSGAFTDAEVQERLTNRYWIGRMRRVVAERLAADPASVRTLP
jgi:hypothetical protein